jgi:hypothetical protein
MNKRVDPPLFTQKLENTGFIQESDVYGSGMDVREWTQFL